MRSSTRLARRSLLYTILLLISLAYGLTQRRHVESATAASKPALSSYGQLPLHFEANQGQSAAPVKFLARGRGYVLFLTNDAATLRLRQGEAEANVALRLLGANPAPRVQGQEPLPGRANYFLGDDPRRWRTAVATFGQVKYTAVYPGIELVWHGRQQQLEHDFLLAPGADPRRIRLRIDGAQSVKLDAQGDLRLGTVAGEVRLQRPVAWQDGGGARREIACAYRLDARGDVTFALGAYDRRRALVIDPVLLYSTLLGGDSSEQANAVAVDRDGNVYLAGETFSADFPGPSAIQPNRGANPQVSDGFVLKLNASGSALVYATWLGGAGSDSVAAIAVGGDGAAYVTGQTGSGDFPRSTNPVFQPDRRGGIEAFVAKLNPAGSALVYSSFLGGENTDNGLGIAVDAGGSAYVVGQTFSYLFVIGRTPDPPGIPGIRRERVTNPLYKSANRAGSWADSGIRLDTQTVNGLAINPRDSQLLYAATNNGVFFSNNGGQNWGNPNDDPNTQMRFANAVAVDPALPLTLYAAAPNGFFKGTAFGRIWTPKNTGLLGAGISANTVIIDPGAPATLYLGTQGGVFKSTNSGESWSFSSRGMGTNPQAPEQNQPNVTRLAIDPINRQTLYAGTNRGMFKTTDGGANWMAINNGLGTGGVSIFSLVLDPSAPNTLYAGTNTLGASSLYKTTDGGATWSARVTGLSVPGFPAALAVNVLEIDPGTPNTLYAGTVFGVFKSTDGAASWSRANNGLNNQVISALAVDRATPATVYAGVNVGADGFAVKVSPNGGALTWATYVGGAENDSATAVAVDANGAAHLTGFTNSDDLPVTATRLQATKRLLSDAFIARINPAGDAFAYSTYLGGDSSDFGRSLAVTSTGQVIVGGTTVSANFPAANAVQPSLGGLNDFFISKLNAAGTALEFSTWLGGSSNDTLGGLALDGAGNIYVTGVTASTNFPQLDPAQNRFGGANDAVVAKLNPAGSALLYSTFLGGQGNETASAIAADALGNVYVAGNTNSQDFPLVKSLQPALRGGNDVFLTKLGVEADLTLTKTVARNPVMIGNPLVYTLTVRNLGPSAATNLVVTDTLPAGVVYGSATGATCQHSNGTVTCALAALAAQATAAITLNTSAPANAGTLNNTARVTAAEPDSNAANNTATLATSVSTLPSIAGRVVDALGRGVAGVRLQINANQSATTDANGAYQIANLPLGQNVTLQPALTGFSFEPPSRSFTNVTADVTADFTATACSYALTPANQTFEAGGGTGTLTVTATARCPWTAASSADWLTITTNPNGEGNGTVGFRVAAATAPRAARLTIGGQVFTVWQGVNACAALKYRAKNFHFFGFPSVLESADFNGDGVADLAVGNQEVEFDFSAQINTLPVNLLLGNANGRLTSTLAVRSPMRTGALTAGDFNGDGRPDLVSVAGNEPFFQLFTNNGNGTFAVPLQLRALPPNTFSYPDAIWPAELNKDGKLDLIFTNSNRELNVALNTGTATRVSFATPFQLSFEGLNLLTIGDVTGDGVSDALVSSFFFNQGSAPQLRVYPGDGIGSFGPPLTSTLTAALQHGVLSDFNGDGRLDVIGLVTVQTQQGNRFRVSVVLGEGAGRFGNQQTFNQLDLEPFDQRARLAVRDLNNDARPEVLLLGNARFMVVSADGNGQLNAATDLASTDGSNSPLLVNDFDGDRRADFATFDGRSSSVRVYFNRCAASGPAIFGGLTERNLPVGLGGVNVRLSGASTASVPTDSGGNYEFNGLTAGGNFTVTPEGGGLTLTPANQTVNNLTADKEINFSFTRQAVAVSAATFASAPLAPASIAAAFGLGLARRTESATTVPLPILLGGQYLYLKDAANVERAAELFFVSANQINFAVPRDTAPGPAMVRVFNPTRDQEPQAFGTVQIESIAPGLFTANANGQGVAAAVVLRVKPGGAQSFEPVARLDAATNRFVALPIDVSDAREQVFLLLFGTGFRNAQVIANSVRIGGTPVELSFLGAQGDLTGLDQVNARLPATLAGRGDVDVVLTAGGKPANTVRINLK